MSNTTYSNEDYLEAILQNEKNGETKSIDVANALDVSKPAVHIATHDLIEKGMITKENYGNIILTKKGRAVAKEVLSKHNIMKNFLLNIGVSQENALSECCKIEHVISKETIECLVRFCKEHGIEL